MPQIDKSKVYSFFFGTNASNTGTQAASRQLSLFDMSGNSAGYVFFYGPEASIPNDSENAMNRPVSDYDDIVAFIQNAPQVYFSFDSAGNGYCYLSDHMNSATSAARPLQAAR